MSNIVNNITVLYKYFCLQFILLFIYALIKRLDIYKYILDILCVAIKTPSENYNF